MTINDYYIKEVQALRSLGVEFSEKNPGLSSFLARKGQDPDVERLLEGFSFLTARLRQYMDEQLPEVAHSMANLLWSNYLKPIPSYSVLQFSADKNISIFVKKGEEVSAIHPRNETECVFQTCYDTEVNPIEITKAIYSSQAGESIIELQFDTLHGASLDELKFKKLRFYLGDHEYVSDDLLLELMNHVQSIDLVLERDVHEVRLKENSIVAVGFGKNENILPIIGNVFSGYRLLQEYFCYRDKYHYIDIENLGALQSFPEDALKSTTSFSIRINLSEKLKITKTITKDNFRLHCVPIINIFDTTAQPIRKGLDNEYEVIPSNIDYVDSEVYSVETVHGWDIKTNKKHKYFPFEAFDHAEEGTYYYSPRVKLAEDESRTRTYLSFDFNKNEQKDHYHDGLTISVDIKATNRDLPSSLTIGDISKSAIGSTISGATFENITVPTKSYSPPIRGDFLWRIISNMSLNYLSLDNVKTLRGILGAYDFIGASNVLQKKQTDALLNGILDISQNSQDMIYKGLPIRGTVTQLTLDSKMFATLGEAYLLTSVLNKFFSLYCSVNSFHKLEVTVDKKALFFWDARLGDQVLF